MKRTCPPSAILEIWASIADHDVIISETYVLSVAAHKVGLGLLRMLSTTLVVGVSELHTLMTKCQRIDEITDIFTDPANDDCSHICGAAFNNKNDVAHCS